MKKRILSVLLCLVMVVVGLLPTVAFADGLSVNPGELDFGTADKGTRLPKRGPSPSRIRAISKSR